MNRAKKSRNSQLVNFYNTDLRRSISRVKQILNTYFGFTIDYMYMGDHNDGELGCH